MFLIVPKVSQKTTVSQPVQLDLEAYEIFLENPDTYGNITDIVTKCSGCTVCNETIAPMPALVNIVVQMGIMVSPA